MKWHCERTEAGWLIVVERNGQQWAALVRADYRYDRPYAFWSAVCRVKWAALGLQTRRPVL